MSAANKRIGSTNVSGSGGKLVEGQGLRRQGPQGGTASLYKKRLMSVQVVVRRRAAQIRNARLDLRTASDILRNCRTELCAYQTKA
jgi:hypothetical protein